MVKRCVISSIAIISLFSFVAVCYCQDQSSVQDLRMRKLGRGAANIFTCPLEIVKQSNDAAGEDGFVAGITVGVIKGVAMTVVRFAAGLLETVTFFAPYPDKDYKPILTDPEFFLKDPMSY